MLTIIKNYSLDDIKDSIKYLLDKASESEEVRQLAIEIIHNKPDPIAAIYDWVKTNVKYTPDPVRNGQIELFISPVRMVKDYRQGKPLAGDCDDMALLAVALCRSIGIHSSVVLLDTAGEGLDHAVSQVSSNGVTLMLDPSANVPLGWEEHYYSKVVV